MKVLKKWILDNKYFWPCQWWLCIFLCWWYKNIFRGGQYQLKCDRCGNIFKSKMNWRFILLSCIPKCDQCGTISPLTKLNFALPHFQNRPFPFLICQNLMEQNLWWLSDLRQNWPFALPDLSKFDGVEFMMVVWPTTKSAFALPDLSKFAGVDFMMVVWPTTKSAFALPDLSIFDVVEFMMVVWPTTKLAFAPPLPFMIEE